MVGKFYVLLFVVYIFLFDIIMKCCIIGKFFFIGSVVIWWINCDFIWGIIE